MTPQRLAWAKVAQLIEDARNLDCFGASHEATFKANQMRHEAEEIARKWALAEETEDA